MLVRLELNNSTKERSLFTPCAHGQRKPLTAGPLYASSVQIQSKTHAQIYMHVQSFGMQSGVLKILQALRFRWMFPLRSHAWLKSNLKGCVKVWTFSNNKTTDDKVILLTCSTNFWGDGAGYLICPPREVWQMLCCGNVNANQNRHYFQWLQPYNSQQSIHVGAAFSHLSFGSKPGYVKLLFTTSIKPDVLRTQAQFNNKKPGISRFAQRVLPSDINVPDIIDGTLTST